MYDLIMQSRMVGSRNINWLNNLNAYNNKNLAMRIMGCSYSRLRFSGTFREYVLIHECSFILRVV